MNEKAKTVFLATGKQARYEDLLKGIVDVDFVARLERKNDSHTVSNKTFDFSKATIRQLIQDGYEETKERDEFRVFGGSTFGFNTGHTW